MVGGWTSRPSSWHWALRSASGGGCATSARRSQEKLAEESTLHVNEVGRVERGETNPELETLVLIATGMKMSLGVLFTAAEKRWWEEHGRGESGEGGSSEIAGT
jgi:transcriptional regulator with XRE-family HTH domain